MQAMKSGNLLLYVKMEQLVLRQRVIDWDFEFSIFAQSYV